MQATPKNVLPEGISLNKKYPGIIDIMIKEYSNRETTEGEATIYAENMHRNAIDATKPKNKINFHVYSMFENHSLNINCVVGSKLELLNWPLPIKIKIITQSKIAIR